MVDHCYRPMLLLCCWSLAIAATAVTNKPKPNIVFLLTDDQDLRLGSYVAMPSAQKYVRATINICQEPHVQLETSAASHQSQKAGDVLAPDGLLV
jgi:hypothetical protein